MDTTFGALLRHHRTRVPLTQEELAERAGLSSQAIGALERGERRHPRSDTVSRLAGALALTDDQHAELAGVARRRGTPAATAALPRQLPPDIAQFTGRAPQITSMIEALERSHTVVVSAIAGMGGIGKTSLAVHVGHRVAERFADGQLYLDLRGGSTPLPPHDALAQLMRAFGLPVDGVPVDLGEAAARYRSAIAGRQVLLILDNAASAEQVAPLLPGTAGSAAIITSRRSLDLLPQVRQLRLDVLADHEAVELLAGTAGRERVDADPEAAEAVVRHCGRLPLAIHLAGARLAARPERSLADAARRLADEHRRLDELERDERGVRASFAVSIDQLDEPDARAFALLSLPGTPTLSLPVAARLLGDGDGDGDNDGERGAERVLERLVDLHLLETTARGGYRMHDLLRVYSHERVTATVSAPDRVAALGRVLDLFVAVAWRSMTPVVGGVRHAWADESWTVGAPEFGGSAEVFAWLDEHRFQLVAITQTPGLPPEPVVRLSIGLFWYYLSRGYWLDWTRIATAALDAARAGGDRFAEALVRMDLGIATAYLARTGEGLALLQQSLADLRALGQQRAVAACLINLGDIHELAGDVEAAIACNEESLAISRDLADIPGAEATTCINLGRLHGAAGDRDRQLDYYRRSLRINESIGYDRGSAAALHLIGVAHREAGRPDEACAPLRRSITLCREIGDPITEAAAWEELGAVHLDRRDQAGAVDALRRGLDLADVYDDRIRRTRIRDLLRRLDA